MDESTARFGFLGASGLTSLCSVVAFGMAFTDRMLPAQIFLVLALVGLGAMIWFRRIYVRLRTIRWQEELRRGQTALDALLQPTPALPSDAPPAGEAAPDGPPTETHERT